MRAILITSALLLSAVAACGPSYTVTADNGQKYTAAPAMVVMPSEGYIPDRKIPSPGEAANIFNKACIDTLPEFSAAPGALSKLGMRRDATGAYQHPKLDLSVALLMAGKAKNCSIIFATNQDTKSTADSVAAYGVKQRKRFFIHVLGGTSDRVYLNAQVTTQ
jgi:hypothetical protein